MARLIQMLKHLATAGLVLPCAVTSTYANNFDYMTGINNLTWTKGALRMNHIQVVGTHNSYHVEAPIEEHKVQQKLLQGQAINYWYSHPQLDIQLGDQQVRNLEIDVLADPEGGNYAKPLVRKESKLQYDHDPVWDEPGVKVLHVPDADIHTLCKSLVGCLEIIKGWLDAHPESVPIPIMMELKTAEKRLQDKGGAKVIPWDTVELMDGLDAEIRSVFGPDQLITPDHVRLGNGTLEDSILRFGWPDLESARGRIFFLMDNGPRHIARDTYKQGRPSLQGRVLFTNASPGDADCAFQKLNNPLGRPNNENIQAQVRAGYWVRTRADEPMGTILDDCDTSMRDAAFASGAHIVSTDFQDYGPSARWGCDYAVKFSGRKGAICNPVHGSGGCDDSTGLEPEEYRLGGY